jgi:hypothetical protein
MGVGLLLIYCNLVRYAAWGFFEKAAIEYNDRATGIVRPEAVGRIIPKANVQCSRQPARGSCVRPDWARCWQYTPYRASSGGLSLALCLATFVSLPIVPSGVVVTVSVGVVEPYAIRFSFIEFGRSDRPLNHFPLHVLSPLLERSSSVGTMLNPAAFWCFGSLADVNVPLFTFTNIDTGQRASG